MILNRHNKFKLGISIYLYLCTVSKQELADNFSKILDYLILQLYISIKKAYFYNVVTTINVNNVNKYFMRS